MKRLIIVFISIGMILSCSVTPEIQKGDGAERFPGSSDLNRVDNSIADVAFANPSVDFSRYKSFVVTPLYLEVIALTTNNVNGKEMALWMLAEEEKSTFQKIFYSEIEKGIVKGGKYTMAVEIQDSPTLLLMCSVVAVFPDGVNLVGGVPVAGEKMHSKLEGVVTIVGALMDAHSKTVIARFVDSKLTRYKIDPANPKVSDIAMRDVFSSWANDLRIRIDQVHAR
ncbi:hypothetical protein A9Q81_17850 [Gammaproteobacteria bacterium 42_54_T18]|nr:hypothetical protein A9Q81_17850 [Gammaproteobacteria bacterium 42_54_T18]